MRYITSVRVVNAFYQSLFKTMKGFDWNAREIVMQTSWHKGVITQYLVVSYDSHWICTIRNDNGKFIVDRWNRTMKVSRKMFVSFLNCFRKELKKEFDIDYQD
nr:MAG TPA: hypothetical protein [Caudoviricetes sp.]